MFGSFPRQAPTVAERTAANRRLFSTVTAGYERAVVLLSLGRDPYWKARLVGGLELADGARCLDVGCGTGTLARAVAAASPTSRVIGLDRVWPMLDVARRRAAGLSNLRLTQQSMDCLGLQPQSIDAVVAAYALRNAPDLHATLAELSRVLRPGGQLAFLDFVPSPRGWERRLQRGVVTLWGACCGLAVLHSAAAGLAIVRSMRLYPDRDALSAMLVACGFTPPAFRMFAMNAIGIGVCRRRSSAVQDDQAKLASTPRSAEPELVEVSLPDARQRDQAHPVQVVAEPSLEPIGLARSVEREIHRTSGG
jgi:ubiquinone/menaquinone biosynthesis methyltransferase